LLIRIINQQYTVDVYAVSGTDYEILSSTEETLACTVSDITAAVTFAWTDSAGGTVTSSDGDYSESEDSQESTITVTPTEDTSYTCSVTDSNADAADIVIIALDVFEVTATDAGVEYGTEGIVTCEITGITELVSVVFSDADGDISNEADVTTVDEGTYDSTTQTATLTVHNVTADGTYTCTVTSGQWTDSAGQETEVSIKMFDISISPVYVITEIGDSQDFVCTATGDSSITVVWSSSDGSDLTSDATQDDYDSGSRISTLSFDAVTADDTLSYTCSIAFGDAGLSKASASMETIEIAGLESAGAEAGEDVTFSCTYTGAGDSDVVTWFLVADGDDTEVTDTVTTDSGAGTTELVLSAVTYSQT